MELSHIYAFALRLTAAFATIFAMPLMFSPPMASEPGIFFMSFFFYQSHDAFYTPLVFFIAVFSSLRHAYMLPIFSSRIAVTAFMPLRHCFTRYAAITREDVTPPMPLDATPLATHYASHYADAYCAV